ncbi:MAG: hypothetical protein ATN31_00840 [Candidatus Epulonipiscioides saccharophilum]|nr:MAG: hypothetical protein ATN31_00840 [Epulopiscium sp. AS2M-Bin001]
MYEKTTIGQQLIDNKKHTYYLLEKKSTYGIEITVQLENSDDQYICTQVYFTEDKELARKICHRVCQGTVTVIGLEDVLDDIVA